MQRLGELWRRLKFIFRRGKFQSELQEEMQFHLEMKARTLRDAGMAPGEAGPAAQRRFGNTLLLRETSREAWGWNLLETILQDVRYGFRQLRRNPGFTLVAVLTLALGIGANTAVFTLVDAVMLKSLPVANPQQLYSLGADDNCCQMTGMEGNFTIYSYPLYRYFQEHNPQFSQLAAFQAGAMSVAVRRSRGAEAAQPYRGEFVSGNYFQTFGVPAYAGRLFTPGDDRSNAPPVAVMSYRAWQQHYGCDAGVIGSTFVINGKVFTIAGITPPAFYGDRLTSDPPDFFLPLGTEPVLSGPISILREPGEFWLYLTGRLKPGVPVASLQAQLTVELQHWLRTLPKLDEGDRKDISQQRIILTPGGAGVTELRGQYASGLHLLTVLAGLVLLIACANLANLLLAKGSAARVQMAARIALGATRARLMRQILTESMLLAVLGGAAGVAVAFLATRMILLLAFRGALYVPIEATPSLPVLAFAFALSLLTGVMFGVAPAWSSSRSQPAEALHGATRSTRDRSALPQKSLVALQAALSLVLLAGAGLLTRSLLNLQSQQFGFQTRGRYIVRVDPSLAGYTMERLPGLYRQLRTQLAAIPGVLSVAYSGYSPMRGENWSNEISVEEHLDEGYKNEFLPWVSKTPSWVRVSPRYFETVGTRLLRGRVITEQDTPSSKRVAVVNETFARKFFPVQDPLGKHFGIGDNTHGWDFEIVGVVEDTKYQDARQPAYATFFLPFLQQIPRGDESDQNAVDGSNYLHDVELLVAGRPQHLESQVRRVLAEIDPNLTVLSMTTFDEQVARNFNQDRLLARLTGLFGLLALTLASVGLYGVTAYNVARRTNEIGIRMALGADRDTVLGMVLRGAIGQVLIGLVIGIPLALAAGRALSSQLFGVKEYDVWALAGAVGTLSACAAVAGLLPARRAASIDPMQALRAE
ncbi:MAG TPA: ABC transporter permease [Terriglobales bacterium]|nr:ABC transporter permease [Terriglobales bacterium]